MYPSYVVQSGGPRKFAGKDLSYISTKADVALDMFLDADPSKAITTTEPSHEVMVWFGRVGDVEPLGGENGSIATHKMHGDTL